MRTYEQDYAGWAEDTAAAIEAGRFDNINLAALADEVRDLGKSERYRLESSLRVLLLHLLKTKYQPEKATLVGRHPSAFSGDMRQGIYEKVQVYVRAFPRL